MKYRYRWCGTREEAVESAIRDKVASREDYPGANVFWEPWAGIEEEEG